jgi:hypothetical protein
MDMISVFSTTVLVTTIATLILAIAAYFAFKLREWRKPKPPDAKKIAIDGTFEPIFLKRHMLNGTAPDENVVEP